LPLSIQRCYYKGISVSRNKMAGMFLGTNDRNGPGNVKGRMVEVTLF
jgi:hypothetical protein